MHPATRCAWQRPGLLVMTALLGLAGSLAEAVPPRGSEAPPVVLQALDGELVETSRFEGQPMVLVFGDLLHEGARRTADDVMDVIDDERFAGRGIVPIFLTAQNSPKETLREQVMASRFPAIVLQDPERSAFGDYQIVVLPSVVVVDPGGIVVYAAPGFLPRFRELLTEALLVSTGQESTEQFERSLAGEETPAPNDNILRAERLVHLAEQLAAHDLNDMAEARCREALTFAPGYEPARIALGELLRKSGRLDDAEAHFRGLLETGGAPTEAQLGLARVLIDRGDGSLDEAEALVRSVLASDVRSPLAHYQLGRVLERRGDCAGAASSYRRAAEFLLGG